MAQICGENVSSDGKIKKFDKETQKKCRKFNKDLFKQALYVHFNRAVIGDNPKFTQTAIDGDATDEENLESTLMAHGMNGMMFDVGLGEVEEEEKPVDPECREEKLEETLESGSCCEEGAFHKHEDVWEVDQNGLKTICGCFDNRVVCEEPNQETMVQKRSRCSLRSNWYVKKIQKMTMTRDDAVDGQIVIRSLVGVEGFKIRENKIYR